MKEGKSRKVEFGNWNVLAQSRLFILEAFRKNTSTKDALMFSCSKERSTVHKFYFKHVTCWNVLKDGGSTRRKVKEKKRVVT